MNVYSLEVKTCSHVLAFAHNVEIELRFFKFFITFNAKTPAYQKF